MANRIWSITAMAFALVLGARVALAQIEDPLMTSKHKIAVIHGHGNQRLLNTGYDFSVNLFQFEYLYALSQNPSLGVELLFQPQFNVTRFLLENKNLPRENGYECGITAGFLARKSVAKGSVGVYSFISSGPQFISGTPERQSPGIIFSSNFFIGLNIKLNKSLYLDLRSGFRHMSNGGTNRSNAGINNVIVGGGILIPIS